MKFKNKKTRSVKIGRVNYKEDQLNEFKKKHPKRYAQLLKLEIIVEDSKNKEKENDKTK